MKQNTYMRTAIIVLLFLFAAFLFSRDGEQPSSVSPSTTSADIPRFEQYEVSEFFSGTPAVDLESNPVGTTFRTVISEEVEQGPNFAGKYTVVSWGCGTSCQNFAIVDAETGFIFGPFPSQQGQEYDLASRLLIVNPPENILQNGIPGPQESRFYVWTGDELQLLQTYTVSEEGRLREVQ